MIEFVTILVIGIAFIELIAKKIVIVVAFADTEFIVKTKLTHHLHAHGRGH